MAGFLQKKLLLVVLTVCLTALSAEIFVFTHLDHECHDEDCPVCLQIEIAQTALKGMAFVFTGAVLASFSPRIILTAKKACSNHVYFATLVTLNIQSNT